MKGMKRDGKGAQKSASTSLVPFSNQDKNCHSGRYPCNKVEHRLRS